MLLCMAPMINVEVQKNEGEATLSLIRRFSRRVKSLGMIQDMRRRRYYARAQSRAVARKHALQVIKRREEVKELIKLGKMVEVDPRNRKKGGRR